MSLTINSFKNMDFFKILEKLKELNPKFDYKSNSIIADEFKIKFIPFENIIVISSLKNGESIKFANKTLDCLSGLVSDDVLFNLMENYDIEELFKKKSINEELFENLKKLKNDSDTYVSKLMEKYEDGLTVEERNKIKDEIKNYNDLVELCDNSMLVKTGDTSVEYEYKKFRFGIIISEPAASMRLNKAFLLQAFAFNLDNNLITKTYYITYEEAVNLGFDPESMKNILNSQVTKSMEYIKAFGISEEIRHLNLVKEFNRLEYYHKKGVIYDSTYNYVIEHLYYDREDVLEESYKEDLVIEEIFNLLKSKNGVNKFLSIAKRIINFESYLYDEVIKYEYKGHKIHLAIYYYIEDLSKLNIEILKNTNNEEQGVLLYYKDVIKLGFNKQRIIDCIFETIIKSMSDREITLQSYSKNISKENYKLMVVGEILSNPIILKFLNENKKHKDYEKVMNLLSSYEYKNNELYEGINLSEKRATKEDIKNEVFDLLKSENGVDKFLSSAKFITSGKKSYSIITEYYYVQYNYKGCKIDIDWDLLVCSIKNLLLTVSIDIDKLTDLYYKDVIKLGFPEKEIIDSIYKKIINVLDFWIEELDEVRKKISITDFLSNSKIMGFLYENKNHKEYERVMKLISLLTHEDDELYEEINLSEIRDVELEKLETEIKKQELHKKRIKNEVAKLLKTEEGIDKFLSSAKKVDLPPEERTFNPSSSEELIYYIYKNVFLELYTAFIVDESTNIYVSELYYDEFLVPYKGAIKLGFDKEKVIDGIYEEILDDLQYEQIDDEYYKLDKNERIKRVSSVFNNQDIMKFLNENKNHKDYKKVIHILKSADNITLYESDYSDSISEKQNNFKILDEVKELFQTSDGIDKFLSSAKLVENNNISSTLFLCNIKYIYKNTEIRINFISLGDPDLSYKNIFFTNLRIDCKDSMFFVNLYYKEAIRLGFDKQKIVDYIYLKLINDIQYDSYYKSSNEFEKIKKISYIINNQEIINFLNDNKDNVDYERFMNIIKSLDYKKATNIINPVDNITLYESDYSDSISEMRNNFKILDEVKELFQTSKGIDKFLSSAKLVENNNKSTFYKLFLDSINYIYKNTEIRISFTNLSHPDLSYKNIFFTHIRIDGVYSMFFVDLYYKEAIRLGLDKDIIIDEIYYTIMYYIKSVLKQEYNVEKVSVLINNPRIWDFLSENKNHKDYKTIMNFFKNNIKNNEVLYEDKNNSEENDILDEIVELLKTEEGIDKFLSSAKKVDAPVEDGVSEEESVRYIYNEQIIVFTVYYIDYTKIYVKINNKKSLVLSYNDAVKLGFDKQNITDYIYMKIIGDIQHDRYYKSLNEFGKIKKILSILNNQEIINFLNDNKDNVWYEKFKNIIKSLDYKKATNIINPVDSKDVLYEDKNNSKVNNIPDEVVKLLNSKKGIDKFLSEAEFDYKTTTNVNYKYKNKTVSIGIDLYNLARDFDKVILRVGHTNRSNPICPVYYKDAIRLGFRKKIVIDHLFEKFFKLYNWYKQNKCYSELINDKVIKFLIDNKTHKDYRKAMRIIKHPYHGDGTIYESKDEKSFNSYPFADYDKTKDVIELLSSKDGIDKFMSEAEILKRYNYGNLYLYKNNIYEFQISPKYDNPTKISLNDFYSITGGRLGLPYTEVIKLGFNESFVVDMVYVAILINIELYKQSIELFNDEVIKFVLAHKNHKHYKTVKNYLEKVIVSYGDELLESKVDETYKNETSDDILKELHEFNTFMESSFGIDKFLSKAKLLKSNEEEPLYQYKNGLYHLYMCPWWYDYKMKNLFIIEIGYERYSENLELKYTNNLFMDYRNAIKLGLNKDKVIKTIYDKIYRFLDDLIKKSKKIEIYNENELNEIMNFLEMSIDYSKEYQEAYNIIKNYITGKSPEEDEMIFESKRK